MIASVSKKNTQTYHFFTRTFEHYIKVFKDLSLEQLKNDQLLIIHLKDVLKNKDFLYNKAFQLAFEVSFNKRFFSSKDLTKIFQKELTLKNPLDKSYISDSIDQSTAYNILQGFYIKDQLNNTEVVIQQTPLNTFNIKDLNPKIQAALNINKTLTGNKFPDLELNEMPYDFKNTKDPTNTLNHVHILVDSDKAIADFYKHILIIENLNNIKYFQNTFPKEYHAIFTHKLNDLVALLKTKPSNKVVKEANIAWNNFIINHPQRPKNSKFPIYMITNESMIVDEVTNPSVKKINIPEGFLDQVKTKETLENYLNTETPELNEKIYEATLGALGHVLKHLP